MEYHTPIVVNHEGGFRLSQNYCCMGHLVLWVCGCVWLVMCICGAARLNSFLLGFPVGWADGKLLGFPVRSGFQLHKKRPKGEMTNRRADSIFSCCKRCLDPPPYSLDPIIAILEFKVMFCRVRLLYTRGI